MSLRTGNSLSITLISATVLLVALAAAVFSSSAGVGAHDCGEPLGTGATPTPVPDVHCEASGHDSTETNHAAISSTEPGTAVAIRLYATATGTDPISAGEKITVDFSGPSADSGFSIPENITATHIEIDPDVTETTTASFSPSDIDVQDKKVILTVPSAGSVSKDKKYTITFNTAAGIENPDYEGYWRIVVSSNVTGDAPDTITALIGRTTINPPEGSRGQTLRLRGESYPTGTVTIFDGDDENVDAGEILDTIVVGSSGTFTSDSLRVPSSLSGLSYRVWTKDSIGEVGSVIYSITEPTTSFDPATARVGDKVTINITDWQPGRTGVASVLIQGQQAYGVTEYKNGGEYCYDNTGLKSADINNVVSFEVNVPDGTLPGMQTVEVYTKDQLEHASCSTDVSQWTKQPDATLKGDATPAISGLIAIVSELPPPSIPDRGLNVIEVDGGLDLELALEVDLPDGRLDGYLDEGDQIAISLPGFDLSKAESDSERVKARIKIERSAGSISPAVLPTDVNVPPSGEEIVLTLPGIEVSPREYLNITIERGTGILTPEIPRGFDDPDEGYPITFTFIDTGSGDTDSGQPNVTDSDSNVVVVKNPLSSTVPSDTRVRVTLVTNTKVRLDSSDEITVDFSGLSDDSEFVIPSSISTTSVRIHPEGLTEDYFNPSGILVQGARVTLTIPSSTPSGRAEPEIEAGANYAIQFQPGARIENPYAAGNLVIEVSSSVDRETIDEIIAVIRRTTTIDTPKGPRGTEFILEGKGYARGTVTVYHDANENESIDAGETLAVATTVRGVFDVDLVARGEPGDLVYRVRTRDSEGAEEEVEFEITSGMLFQPATARVGSPLKITISDWQEPDREVAAVRIAGVTAYVAEVREYENCFDYTGVYRADSDGVVSLEVDVPRHVPGGQQTVSVYDHEQLRVVDGEEQEVGDKVPCADLPEGDTRGDQVTRDVEARLKDDPIAIIKDTIDIDTQDLVLSPSTAARGQRVTITGSGFTRASGGRSHIESVWIGGREVVDDHSEFEVGTDGTVALNVAVPLDIADGPNEVRIEGSDNTLGQATLTIPEASIALEPTGSQRGTKFTVTGSGFVANEVVLVTYYSGTAVTTRSTELGSSGILADSQGRFELEFKVPITAEVGLSHLVKATAEVETRNDRVVVEADAEHLVAYAGITTTPDAVSPGDRLTIRGEHLPPFTLVGPFEIAGIPLSPKSEVATDEHGSFETTVLIPQMDFRDHTLLVQVGGVIIPHIVEVAPPPLSGPPAQVFKALIKGGALLTVWHYDNATQLWSLFDPSLPAEMTELNDLTEVASGDIVWLNMSKPEWFQSKDLVAGWNLVELK